MFDLFEQLQPCSWRGVPFACNSFAIDLSQDIAQHKKPDLDGARIEATGRNPREFTAHCLFRNNILRGRAETLIKDPFPDQFLAFIEGMADRSTGKLVHPLYGPIPCKPMRAGATIVATSRDGVDVEAHWIEADDSTALAPSTDPIVDAQGYADDVDAAVKAHPKIKDPGDPIDPSVSLGEGLRQLKGFGDKVTLVSKKLGGRINSLVYRVESISDSIDKLHDATFWPAKQSCMRLLDSLSRLSLSAIGAKSDILIYRVPGDTTLGSIAAKLGTSTGTLIKLNPKLAESLVVKRDTLVRWSALKLTSAA